MPLYIVCIATTFIQLDNKMEWHAPENAQETTILRYLNKQVSYVHIILCADYLYKGIRVILRIRCSELGMMQYSIRGIRQLHSYME